MNTSATQCTQPGCSETIDDGYCSVCGMAAAPAPVPSAGTGQERSPVSAATGTAGRAGTRSSQPRTSRVSRGNLGAGLVEIPPVPVHDPASAVLSDPQVPESK